MVTEMVAPFDIFRKESDGIRWLEFATDLETATARVQAIGELSPGEYLIFSQITGHKISIIVVEGTPGKRQTV
jgi:hypothetical protein